MPLPLFINSCGTFKNPHTIRKSRVRISLGGGLVFLSSKCDVSRPACRVRGHERKNSHKLKGLCRVLDHVDVGALKIKFPSRQLPSEFHARAYVSFTRVYFAR